MTDSPYSRASRIQKYVERNKEAAPAPAPPIVRSPQAVGFWYNKYEGQDLPMPVANPNGWEGQEAFLAKLVSVEKPLMNRHRAVNRHNNALLDLPRAERGPEKEQDGTVIAYRGYSPCRCCQKSVGSVEFHYLGWVWPEGYIHYLRDHNVLPDEGFMNFILNL